MNKLQTFFKRLREKLTAVVRRYPVSIVLLLAAATMIMFVINAGYNTTSYDDEVFVKLGMSLAYGAILSLVISAFSERLNTKGVIKWAPHVLSAAAILLIYYILLFDMYEMVTVVRYLLLCFLTAALFFFIPFVKADKSASYFAQKVFLRLAVTGIYYGIIVGGVEAILFAIENLLSVNLPDQIYEQTAMLLAGLFIPSFFFAGIPDKYDPQTDYPKLLKILLHYIVYTLLAAYTVVLYAYFIKILVEWQLPSNLLGNLVIYYSLISVAALYFGDYAKDENKWSRIFYNVYPYLLILPTLMMLLSFIVRINQYGFTESRYYAILCVIFVLRSISVIKLQKKVMLIPLVLSVLTLVSIFGPLSAFSVSKWSQNRRFEKILTESGMLDNGVITPDSDASDETKYEITQIISYFDSYHDTSDLKLLDSEFDSTEMEAYFGFERFYTNKYVESTEYSYLDTDYWSSRIVETDGFSYVAEVYSRSGNIEFSADEGDLTIITEGEDASSLYISLGEEIIYEADMYEIMLPYMTSSYETLDYVPTYTDENDAIKVKMILISATYERDSEDLYYEIKLLFTIK